MVLISKWQTEEARGIDATVVLSGDAQIFLLLQKDALHSDLAKLCAKKNYHSSIIQILVHVSKPRYVRLTTLKMDFDSVFLDLSKQHKI
ncbi:hypothetical protein C5167_037351 [Papaver somniferum]|uniref:Uncharacterized protein n=1 Tax=Papaver somniferum TaxID=3469 RepID=A0A4Y7I990_PAPSO|nr:hypothetical protein C5167_037351 [Papaver somniferum]